MSTNRYTAELSKTAAAIDELREVARFWEPGLPADELKRRVVASGGLGRSSTTRISDIVTRTFAQRLLRPNDAPARRVKAAANAGIPHSEFAELILLYTLRAQPPLRDFLVERYWPATFAGHQTMHGKEIQQFLDEQNGTERNPEGWSPQVTARVARNLGKALTDFGFFEDKRSTVRRIRYWSASDFLISFLVVEAHEDGYGDTKILSLPEWKAFGFDEREKVERLGRIAGTSEPFLFQYSGEIAQFSWRLPTVMELINAHVRRVV